MSCEKHQKAECDTDSGTSEELSERPSRRSKRLERKVQNPKYGKEFVMAEKEASEKGDRDVKPPPRKAGKKVAVTEGNGNDTELQEQGDTVEDESEISEQITGVANQNCEAAETEEDEAEAEDSADKAFEALEAALNANNDTCSSVIGKAREKKVVDVDGKCPLEQCLNYLYRILLRKDVNGYFEYPVTENVAPGYSTIIKKPMCLSVMKSKIQNEEYTNVAEFRSDFELICSNATMFNEPDSSIYSAVKQFHRVGQKVLSNERLISMKRNLLFMDDVTYEQLGFTEVSLKLHLTNKSTDKWKGRAAIRDKLTTAQVHDINNEAADRAAERLHKKYSRDPKIGYLRHDSQEGRLTYSILNPDDDGVVSNTERVIKLGEHVAQKSRRPQYGAPLYNTALEHPNNIVKPVRYLNYGPFCSFAPQYDSMTASLSKEHSDLLHSAYNTELGLKYAESLYRYVGSENEYLLKMADGILDSLTAGKHSSQAAPLMKKMEEERELLHNVSAARSEVESTTSSSQSSSVSTRGKAATSSQQEKEIDFDSLKSLQKDIGIDMTFLDNLEKELKMEEKLREVGQSLGELEEVQMKRLSRPLPHNNSNFVPDPDPKETTLGVAAAKQLTEAIKMVKPLDVVSSSSVNKALGLEAASTEDLVGKMNAKIEDAEVVKAAEAARSKKPTKLVLNPESGEMELEVVEEEEEENDGMEGINETNSIPDGSSSTTATGVLLSPKIVKLKADSAAAAEEAVEEAAMAASSLKKEVKDAVEEDAGGPSGNRQTPGDGSTSAGAMEVDGELCGIEMKSEDTRSLGSAGSEDCKPQTTEAVSPSGIASELPASVGARQRESVEAIEIDSSTLDSVIGQSIHLG